MEYTQIFRAPSVRKLRELHWLDDDQCKALRKAMKQPIEFSTGEHPSHAILRRMRELDKLADTFGVESIVTRRAAYDYLNTGDTYAATILANCDSRTFFVGSWGDIVEREGGGSLY